MSISALPHASPEEQQEPVGDDGRAEESTRIADEQAAEARAAVRSEVSDYLTARSERRRLFPRAALTGILAGTVALAFRKTLEIGDTARAAMYDFAHRLPPAIGWLIPLLWCAAGAGAAVLLVRRMAPEASGSGIPHLEAVLRRLRPFRWARVLPVKFIGGALSIGLSGFAAGREGPTVQMGGAVGDGVASLFKGTFRDRETLITAGAGAGLAAAFNAPLSGLVFVLEEVRREFTPLIFGAALVASVMADLVARIATGQMPVFRVPAYPTPDLRLVPAFLALGVIVGLFGVVFNKLLIGTLNVFARVQRRVPAVAAAAFAGAVTGLVGWYRPDLLGGGHGLAETALAGGVALSVIPLFFLVRFVLTMIAYGCGAPGGIFAPMLALGALVGLAVGYGAHILLPNLAPSPGLFAVVGMAAYFTAIVRAPLTGIVLIVEMTGSYAQMLPLLAACFAAYAIAEGLGDKPIYEVLLERDLARGGEMPHLREPQVIIVAVEHGAPFDGKPIRELGLPPGCILVSIRRGFEDIVPVAATVVQAEDRLTAIVSPDAAGGTAPLRGGAARRAD